MTTTNQQPEERLREMLASLKDVATTEDGEYVLAEETIDDIMQAVKAEIGVAIGEDETEDPADFYLSLVHCRNELRAELRNHFGIREDGNG